MKIVKYYEFLIKSTADNINKTNWNSSLINISTIMILNTFYFYFLLMNPITIKMEA